MVKVTIDGKACDAEEILRWEASRVPVARRVLEKRLKRAVPVETAEELARFKAEVPDEEMLAAFKGELAFSDLATGVVVRLSGGRRKFSVTEMDLDFCDAKTLQRAFNDMMLDNTPENRLACLRANPDHYLLRGMGQDVQEVMEYTGGLPVISLFHIRYGDFAGLRSPQDPAYPLQAAGVSYLRGGLAIGAVRHQMRDTPGGCHVKLTVEFPSLMPDRNVRIHQRHLACEFYNWFSEIERRMG